MEKEKHTSITTQRSYNMKVLTYARENFGPKPRQEAKRSFKDVGTLKCSCKVAKARGEGKNKPHDRMLQECARVWLKEGKKSGPKAHASMHTRPRWGPLTQIQILSQKGKNTWDLITLKVYPSIVLAIFSSTKKLQRITCMVAQIRNPRLRSHALENEVPMVAYLENE